MRRHRRRTLERALASALFALGAVGAAGSSASGAPASALRYADSAASLAYKLPLRKSCEVGDGLAIVKNVSATALRLRSVTVLYGKGARAAEAHTTYELISFRRGTNDGQLGATFDLTGLSRGVKLGNAVGGVLEPIATSGREYVVVAEVLVVRNHPRAWSIDGLRVTYVAGSKSYATILPQSITIGATTRC